MKHTVIKKAGKKESFRKQMFFQCFVFPHLFYTQIRHMLPIFTENLMTSFPSGLRATEDRVPT